MHHDGHGPASTPHSAHDSTHDNAHAGIPEHDRGLRFDLRTLHRRRSALALFGGAGLAALAACAPGSQPARPPTTSAGTTPSGSPAAAGPLEEIPEETAGPFPGDGSNGPNVLTESGIVRSDIRSSYGSMRGAAEGVPLRVELTVVEADTGAPLPGAAVYVWHCDRAGDYSLYSPAAANQNYLRGVQAADRAGTLAFTSVFPAAYAGRWPHVHFEVYATLSDATSAGAKLTTSQLALPQGACEVVYATDGYGRSVRNLAQASLDGDLVFGAGHDGQLATVTGEVASGYVARLTVPV